MNPSRRGPWTPRPSRRPPPLCCPTSTTPPRSHSPSNRAAARPVQRLNPSPNCGSAEGHSLEVGDHVGGVVADSPRPQLAHGTVALLAESNQLRDHPLVLAE